MAPLPDSGSSIKSYLSSLLKRTPSSTATTLSDLSPQTAYLAARAQNLLPRDAPANSGNGITPVQSINNNAVFALFGLIGVGFVVTGIWFFFWAKNGGFYFKENDWDDYKSTVLRRKGPNGTTLSGASESTDLGGGSVVHGEKKSLFGRKGKKGRAHPKKGHKKRYQDVEDEGSQISGSAGGSSLGSEMSELKFQIKNKKNKKASGLRGGDIADEELDVGMEDAVRAYRHEKPARVGGINKQPDGSSWDGSNDNSTAASDLLSNREKTPTNTPTKIKKERNDNYTGGTGGIRKVVSTSESTSFWSRGSGSNKKNEEEDRIKSEAKRLQEKGRAAQRRDFSFQIGDDSSVGDDERRARREEREHRRASRSPTKNVPGSYYDESVVGSNASSDIGTKSYHHPIPGLSTISGSEYAEERRKKRAGGYRRGED
jgi:hypothetical protein